MALRLIDVFFTGSEAADDALAGILEQCAIVDHWKAPPRNDRTHHKILVKPGDAEAVVDRLGDEFGTDQGFRVVLLPVEATVPEPVDDPAASEDGLQGSSTRVAREELVADVLETVEGSRVFFLQVFLSTIVAAVGLIDDNVAVIIGAMVIAPLLGPNIALALGATLGNDSLVRKSLIVSAQGAGLALAVAVAIGAMISFDEEVGAIASRTVVSASDIVLALCAGAAGTLAFTTGASASLIGVMVAVALMPPLVVFGMLLGSGPLAGAAGAALLVVANIVCVNLAAVTTFMLYGVRPRGWWRQREARRKSRWALFAWGAMLVAISLLVWFLRRG